MANAHSSEIFTLLQELIAIPSVSTDLDQCENALLWVENYFKGTSWRVRRQRKSNTSSPALYIAKDATRVHSKVLLLLHVDVVPHKEYQLKGIPTGRVYGRGVSDMKGPTVALLHIVKALNPAQQDVALLVVTDEETGGIEGAKFCFDDDSGPHITCDVCLCPDGGDDFKVVTHEKGVLRCHVSAMGQAAHSAYLWRGENAIETLMAMVDKLLKAADSEGKPIFDNRDNHWHTTGCVTRIEGGQAVNQVPGHARATLDIRFTEQWTASTLKATILQALPEAEIDFFFEQNMLLCPTDSVWIKDTVAAIKDITKADEVSFTRGHGTSDGHWASFAVVMFKPMGGDLHGDNEWLDFPSLLTYYEVARKLITAWAAV